jgi:Ulp1 family protease
MDSKSSAYAECGVGNLKRKYFFLEKKILFPINIRSQHWVLVVANISVKEILYYNSNDGGGKIAQKYANYALRYIMDEYKSTREP